MVDGEDSGECNGESDGGLESVSSDTPLLAVMLD